MGDSGMTPSVLIEGMLDYPFSNIKSDYMDIFLSSICTMMIGTSSGMSHVPMLFNKRILYTNWMPFGDFLFSRKSMTITKTLYRNGDRIPFLTMNREFRGVYNRLLFDLNDVVVVDNSPEEILQAVQDMEKYPDGEIDYSNPLKVRIAPSFAKKMGIV
jgi:putative glycosyltransferase (TIGR04372 family)